MISLLTESYHHSPTKELFQSRTVHIIFTETRNISYQVPKAFNLNIVYIYISQILWHYHINCTKCLFAVLSQRRIPSFLSPVENSPFLPWHSVNILIRINSCHIEGRSFRSWSTNVTQKNVIWHTKKIGKIRNKENICNNIKNLHIFVLLTDF